MNFIRNRPSLSSKTSNVCFHISSQFKAYLGHDNSIKRRFDTTYISFCIIPKEKFHLTTRSRLLELFYHKYISKISMIILTTSWKKTLGKVNDFLMGQHACFKGKRFHVYADTHQKVVSHQKF